MTNLEIVEKATKYTTDIYKEVYYPTKVQNGMLTYEGLKYYANCYTAKCLRQAILAEDGICNAYPIRGSINLREKMATIGKNGILNELLKNIVNVVTYLRMKGTDFAESKESSFKKNMNNDELIVVIFNNLDYFGVEKVYSLLEESEILYNVCLAFAKYRNEEFKDKLDYVSNNNPEAEYLNKMLQNYYESLESEKVKGLK